MHTMADGDSTRDTRAGNIVGSIRVDAVPRTVDALLAWTDEEVEVLQGSALRERAVSRRALVRRE